MPNKELIDVEIIKRGREREKVGRKGDGAEGRTE